MPIKFLSSDYAYFLGLTAFINLQGHDFTGTLGRIKSISGALVNFVLQMHIIAMKDRTERYLPAEKE